jgi:hypothetical protein
LEDRGQRSARADQLAHLELGAKLARGIRLDAPRLVPEQAIRHAPDVMREQRRAANVGVAERPRLRAILQVDHADRRRPAHGCA